MKILVCKRYRVEEIKEEKGHGLVGYIYSKQCPFLLLKGMIKSIHLPIILNRLQFIMGSIL